MERSRRGRWRGLIILQTLLLILALAVNTFSPSAGHRQYMLVGAYLTGTKDLLVETLMFIANLLLALGAMLIVRRLSPREGPRWRPMVARIAAALLLVSLFDPDITFEGDTPAALRTCLLPIATVLYLVLLTHWMRERRKHETA